MADGLEGFLAEFTQEVTAVAHATGDLTRPAMVDAIAGKLAAADELPELTRCYHHGVGHRRRALELDGYCVEELDFDGTLLVAILVEYRGSAVCSLTTTDVANASKRALAFVEEAIEGRLQATLEPSTPAADLAQLITAKKDAIRTVRVLVLSNGALGSRYKEVQSNGLGRIRTEVQVWDLVRLKQLSDMGGREQLEIDVTAYAPNGLPTLDASVGSSDYAACLCVVPGSFLARIYEDHGSRLLEGNVRAFLSTKGNVNKGMRRTINQQPHSFFAFNNGITATASSVERGQDGSITKIRDLQIVNGGQTTASLFDAKASGDSNLDGIFVQMKLTVLPPEVAKSLIPDISRFANTQNKISDADLFANHPFHRKVEEISRRLWTVPLAGAPHGTHWFYERARAQYQAEQMQMTQGQRKAFQAMNPKAQVITKTDIAKYDNAWRQQPHIVSHGAQKNFVKYAEAIRQEYEDRPDEFNDRWFQQLVAKALIFKETERRVSNASWYGQAYRANIVAYAIARTVHLVAMTFPGRLVDLDAIWRAQAVPKSLSDQLEQAGNVALGRLMAPPNVNANITEWAKRERCWTLLKETNVPVVDGLEDCLTKLDDERDQRRRARAQEREVGAIRMIQDAVAKSQSGFWQRAVASPVAARVLRPVELGVMRTAASRGPGWVPSDLQAKVLANAAKKLEAEGIC